MGLSAIPRGGKSIPALGGGAQHPRQQAASLPGERGGRIHRWQGSGAGGGRLPRKGILSSPRLSGCPRRWTHLERSTDSVRPAASPSGDPQPACCKHTHSTRMQARVREDIYLRNNSLAKELSLVAGESGLQPAHLPTPGYLVIHGFIFSFRQTPLFPPCHLVHEEFGSKMVFLLFLSHSSCCLCMGERRCNNPLLGPCRLLAGRFPSPAQSLQPCLGSAGQERGCSRQPACRQGRLVPTGHSSARAQQLKYLHPSLFLL